MATDPTALPNFNGRPVPWITRWSGEVQPDAYHYGAALTGDPAAGEFHVTYPDGKNMRDAKGILWQREGLGRNGEPMWADVSTYRQRAAMTRGLCQVCGTKINTRPFRFLIPVDGMERFDADTLVTMQPPVCEECVPLALRLCPALKRDGYQLLKVLDYTLWGVMGQVTFYESAESGFRKMQGTVSFEDLEKYGATFRLDHVMAQQMVVQIGKHVIEESHVGNRPPTKVSAMDEILHRLEDAGARQSIQNELAKLRTEEPTGG